MKRYLFIIFFVFIQPILALCPDSALLMTYSAKTLSQYEKGESDIATSITGLTQIINLEINKLEQSNLSEFKNIENLKESEALIKLKNNFYYEQQNELQGIINTIKAE
ncbi:hypothetical protein [Helicobacter sp. MIT 14-3879]|uniref:hypothetical protein n=1 Tax=Helicobacter sp. MIT 14-3879 TaxID=2040649 RepID=UPI000E1F3E0C|nr:hypothetical protein [Helicobacter sp. MIT 14-3879]RDU61495.1 hypothetical protein CQA44_08790 [Helicobacter sp. MIT 14-3879]